MGPWARRLALRLLRRDPGEIERLATSFRIATGQGRELVASVGRTFLGGYNAMLGAESLAQVAEQGRRVAPHWRPFFFEGAAMGYLPRGYHERSCCAARAERDLAGLDPRFRYLYYVGLGFWFGFRHARRPERLERLAAHLDALYYPLCFDGWGFKLGFFDYPRRPGVVRRLERASGIAGAALHQGFGRAMFFAYMDDPQGFRDLAGRLPPARRAELECGRALALGFTGIDRPEALVAHLDEARGTEELGARLTGIAWALAAREMNDPDYFRDCLAGAGAAEAAWLERLPALCELARAEAASYGDWQSRTREAARQWYGVRPGRA